MQYLTYEEYREIGGMLDETAFDRNIDRACLMVDRHTQGRFAEFERLPKGLLLLCRDLVEYITANTVDKGVVTSRSQSAGAVSESESYATKSAEDYSNDIENMMEDYLMGICTRNGIPVLYRGAAS